MTMTAAMATAKAKARAINTDTIKTKNKRKIKNIRKAKNTMTEIIMIAIIDTMTNNCSKKAAPFWSGFFYARPTGVSRAGIKLL